MRAGIILVNSVIGNHFNNIPSNSISFAIPLRELEVYKRGLNQILTSIKALTNISLELERVVVGLPEDIDLYITISDKGNVILENIRKALNGHPEVIPEMMKDTEGYLKICSEALSSQNM